jgi:hypothetical protein
LVELYEITELLGLMNAFLLASTTAFIFADGQSTLSRGGTAVIAGTTFVLPTGDGSLIVATASPTPGGEQTTSTTVNPLQFEGTAGDSCDASSIISKLTGIWSLLLGIVYWI